VLSVQRLSARAVLDESPAALAHAEALAADGDESWEQWVTEYQRGEALIVRLELALEVVDREGEILTATHHGFFVEHRFHAPQLEQQIAELASGELVILADRFAGEGHQLDARELGMMYVHVELDPGLVRRLRDRSAPPS
jgi:hypothetical protein